MRCVAAVLSHAARRIVCCGSNKMALITSFPVELITHTRANYDWNGGAAVPRRAASAQRGVVPTHTLCVQNAASQYVTQVTL